MLTSDRCTKLSLTAFAVAWPFRSSAAVSYDRLLWIMISWSWAIYRLTSLKLPLIRFSRTSMLMLWASNCISYDRNVPEQERLSDLTFESLWLISWSGFCSSCTTPIVFLDDFIRATSGNTLSCKYCSLCKTQNPFWSSVVGLDKSRASAVSS